MDSTGARHNLPFAWRLALRTCPYCSGVDDCHWCASTGDLFGHMLERTYEMGREEALEAMRAVYTDWVRAGQAAADTAPPAAQLKARLGL